MAGEVVSSSSFGSPVLFGQCHPNDDDIEPLEMDTKATGEKLTTTL
jgi:hypothetical protein